MGVTLRKIREDNRDVVLATELLTSYVPGDDGPGPFYARLGFVPTGEVDDTGETILRLALP